MEESYDKILLFASINLLLTNKLFCTLAEWKYCLTLAMRGPATEWIHQCYQTRKVSLDDTAYVKHSATIPLRCTGALPAQVSVPAASETRFLISISLNNADNNLASITLAKCSAEIVPSMPLKFAKNLKLSFVYISST